MNETLHENARSFLFVLDWGYLFFYCILNVTIECSFDTVLKVYKGEMMI